MKRRDLLSNSVAAFAFGCLPGNAQTPPKRAAIVIGVDKCRAVDFATLEGASSGALKIKKWLEEEKYDIVIPFVDEGGTRSVKIVDISQAIKELIDKGIYQQLVIYFAGHGYYKGEEEVWMLSESPETSYEAIGLNSTARSAKWCGIPHITVISDACRSPASTVSLLNVTPVNIFPNKNGLGTPGKIDRFFATQTGTAATEAKIDESLKLQGLFTETFLAAFSRPVSDMVKILSDGTKVVPNRRLEKFLISEVQKLAQSIDFNLKQTPECDVPSDEDFYIAQVKPDAPISNRTIQQTIPSWNAINSSEFSKIGLQLPGLYSPFTQASLDQAAETTGFTTAVQVVKTAYSASDLWREVGTGGTGFVIVGKRVVLVAVNPSNKASVRTIGNRTVIFIEIGNEKTACSVAVKFEDQTGTILAALKNFVGTVTTSTDAVVNVSYDPEFAVGQPEGNIADLRATAAAAYRSGVLRFQGVEEERQKQAEQFGNVIRGGKSIDPSLGVYAAYAYDEANLPEKVSSVRSFMRQELNINIFDVAMLDGKGFEGESGENIVPFCPVLGIGWSYLNSTNVELRSAVDSARPYLISSPWTAFKEEGITILVAALEDGTLL